jgi:endo-1,4-beta-xylanase
VTFKISGKTGTVGGSRTWTITAANPSSAPAYGTQITGFTLTQTGGAACSPVIMPPGGSFPVALGDIPGAGTALATFNINFAGCPNTARFTVAIPWSSAVYNTGKLVSGNQFQ